jgi:hypothetical protein
MKHNNLLLCFFLLCSLFMACSNEEPLPDTPEASRSRTVLVYLGVDNNFSDEAAQKIRQLTNGWSKNFDGNLLVYADAGEKPALVHIYHSGLRGNTADTIETYTAENSADPAVFTRVMQTVTERYPAASFGLVVLSHATGWLPAEMSAPSISLRSIVFDRGNGNAGTQNYMELTDFAAAIPCKLDFIVFDACFMGAVEVACELKDKADYIVASPAEVLAPGFVYATMMQRLFKPQADLVAVAREFYEYCNDTVQSGLPRSATVSVVKTAELAPLAAFVREITQANAHLENPDNLQTYGYGRQKIYFDLGDYLQALSPEMSDRLQNLLNKCVVYKAATPCYYSAGADRMQPVHAFSGLSVYIPQPAYPQANAAYRRLQWAQMTGM